MTTIFNPVEKVQGVTKEYIKAKYPTKGYLNNQLVTVNNTIETFVDTVENDSI